MTATKAEHLKPHLKLMGSPMDPSGSIAANITSENDICALVAVGQNEVLLLHNFFWDRKMPLQPTNSGRTFGLQGVFRSPNPVSLPTPDTLAKPDDWKGIPAPDWTAFNAASNADAIRQLAPKSSTKFAGRPLQMVPPSVLGYLMALDTNDPAELCVHVVRYCRDFNTRAAGPRVDSQEDDDEETKQDDEEEVEEDENGDFVVVAGTLVQEVILPLMQWLWAVSCGSITPVLPGIHIPARVNKWCDDMVRQCLLGGSPAEAGTFPPGAMPPSLVALAAATTALVELTSEMWNGRSTSSS